MGGNRRPSMEGVVVLRKWGEGSPLSVRARPPWAVVVLRWGASPYVGGQRSWMGGGPSTSVVVPIGGGRCCRRPSSLGPRVKGWAWFAHLSCVSGLVGLRGGGESTRSMARLPSIVYMAHLAAAGPLFPWPPVAPFPPFPLSFVAWSSKSGAVGSRSAS
jgi:hypothetical protein